MKFLRFSTVLCQLLVCFFLCGCIYGGSQLLTKQFAVNLDFKQSTDNQSIEIHGICGHSAYYVKKVVVNPEHDGVVLVQVFVGSPTIFSEGSGDFSAKIPVSRTLKAISIGKVEDTVYVIK